MKFFPVAVLGAALFLSCGSRSHDVEKLTYWMTIGANVSANYSNMGQTPYAQKLQEKTGIQVEYLHPPSGSANEQFNMIIASGDLPDIMERNWLSYKGGPESAITDGIVLRLNDVFEKYAPNMLAYLKANPDINRMIRTDNDSYYCFPFIRGDFMLLISAGILVRQDWLDELGMDVPETIDDWYTVLRAFKKRNGSAPFINSNFAHNPFANAYGVIPRDFMVGDDGKVLYSPIENGYRDYIATIAKWYSEGLVDPDTFSSTYDLVSARMIGSITGVAVASIGSGMGVWTNSARSRQYLSFKLTGAPIPVLNKGDTPRIFYAQYPYAAMSSAAITTRAKNVEKAARFLDYSYSEEGHILNNFGVEGESFNWADGYPAYSDFITKNPDGWPISQALAAYTRSHDVGPFIQDKRYIEQYYTLPEQKKALATWVQPYMLKYIVPPITPSREESAELSMIMSEVNTYQQEMEVKFIIGTEKLMNWNTYVSTIRRLGIDRAIEIMNTALSRYNSRN